MKIYKLLFLTILASFAFSCSQDKLDQQSAGETNDKLAIDQFDNSYLGVYKGLFSTNDGLTRGSVVVTLTPSHEAVAQITLSSGEIIELKSSKVKLTMDNSVENLNFSSAGLSNIDASLRFSVEGDGANPVITDVTFNNIQSDILIAKNLARAPLNTITGTYMRTAGTGGFPTSARTWNVMSIGFGNQTYATQIFYGNRLYTTMPTGVQSNCSNTGDLTTCTIVGSARILGYDVDWSGIHIYDRYTDNTECSEVSGTWSAPAYGGSSGTFVSDSDCSSSSISNDFCEDADVVSIGQSAVGFTDAFGFTATNGDTPNFCDDDLWGSADGIGVWYSLTPDEDAFVQVDTNGSDFDTQLRVFSGTCGSLVCIDNNDDGGIGTRSLITFSATANTSYYIFIGGYNTAAGNYVLNVSEVLPPPPFNLNLTCGEFLIDNGEGGNYAANSLDTYLIDAGAGNTISLNFLEFDLEDYWDDLVIYDGPNTSSPVVTTSVGGASNIYGQNGGFTWGDLEDDSILSSGRYLTLVFSSDNSNSYGGFLAEVVCLSARLSDVGMQTTSLTDDYSVISVPRHAKAVSTSPNKGQLKTAEYYSSQQ